MGPAVGWGPADDAGALYFRLFWSVASESTDTSGVGTRKDMPVSLPLVAGSTSPTALVRPRASGLAEPHRPQPGLEPGDALPGLGRVWRLAGASGRAGHGQLDLDPRLLVGRHDHAVDGENG